MANTSTRQNRALWKWVGLIWLRFWGRTFYGGDSQLSILETYVTWATEDVLSVRKGIHSRALKSMQVTSFKWNLIKFCDLRSDLNLFKHVLSRNARVLNNLAMAENGWFFFPCPIFRMTMMSKVWIWTSSGRVGNHQLYQLDQISGGLNFQSHRGSSGHCRETGRSTELAVSSYKNNSQLLSRLSRIWSGTVLWDSRGGDYPLTAEHADRLEAGAWP